jgi:hypothetical protein
VTLEHGSSKMENCGHIVAGRTGLKWAYMLTIEDVFAEVKKRFNAKKVCLPPASTVHRSGGESTVFLQKVPSTQIKSGVICPPRIADKENLTLRSGAQDEKSKGMAGPSFARGTSRMSS